MLSFKLQFNGKLVYELVVQIVVGLMTFETTFIPLLNLAGSVDV